MGELPLKHRRACESHRDEQTVKTASCESARSVSEIRESRETLYPSRVKRSCFDLRPVISIITSIGSIFGSYRDCVLQQVVYSR